jgi:hypothetical protein
MPTWHKDDLVPGRECGDCQVCCIMPSIDKPEIQKVSGAPCRHSLKGGCGIYESRPDVCRVFFCGWRRLAGVPDGWRPDTSGVFALVEVNELPQFEFLALALILTGNPLKTIRRPDFIDFVIRNVRNNVALYLMLPGARGDKSARLQLNNAPIMEAAARSRGDVKTVLELLLKKLQAFPPTPNVMQHSGQDVST